jgi:hypothetical protein
MAQKQPDANGEVPDDLRAKAEDARRELAREDERVSPDPGSDHAAAAADDLESGDASEVVRQRAEDQRLEAAQESARRELRARRSESD